EEEVAKSAQRGGLAGLVRTIDQMKALLPGRQVDGGFREGAEGEQIEAEDLHRVSPSGTSRPTSSSRTCSSRLRSPSGESKSSRSSPSRSSKGSLRRRSANSPLASISVCSSASSSAR